MEKFARHTDRRPPRRLIRPSPCERAGPLDRPRPRAEPPRPPRHPAPRCHRRFAGFGRRTPTTPRYSTY
ncbi:MAG: hypothetical protein EOO73_11815 [Myxococcales bacterium]|nr:MAG: hypothetical protein EOO73_11815 [Myxococcales bacterium]